MHVMSANFKEFLCGHVRIDEIDNTLISLSVVTTFSTWNPSWQFVESICLYASLRGISTSSLTAESKSQASLCLHPMATTVLQTFSSFFS
jgi:hypothetical protein